MNIGLVNIQIIRERPAHAAQCPELPIRMENPLFKLGFDTAHVSAPIPLSDAHIINLFRLLLESGESLENEDELNHLAGYVTGKLFQLL